MRLLKIVVVCCCWIAGPVWAQSNLETSLRSIVYNVNELPEFPEGAYSSLLGILVSSAHDLYVHEPLDLLIVTRENHQERSIILDFYRLSTLLRSSLEDRKPVLSFPVTIGEALTKERMSTRVDLAFHPTQPLIYMRLRGAHVSNEKRDLFREHYKQPFIIFQWRNNQATMVFRSNFPKHASSNEPGTMFVPHRGDRMYFGNVEFPPTRPNRRNNEPSLAWIPLGANGLPSAAPDQLEVEVATDMSTISPWSFNFGRQMVEIEKDVYLISSTLGPILYNPGLRRSPVSFSMGSRREPESWVAHHRKYPSIYFADSQRIGRVGYYKGTYTDVLQEGWIGSNVHGIPTVMSRYNILAVPYGLGILAVALDEYGRLTPRAYVYRVTGGVSNVYYHEASGKLIYTTHRREALR